MFSQLLGGALSDGVFHVTMRLEDNAPQLSIAKLTKSIPHTQYACQLISRPVCLFQFSTGCPNLVSARNRIPANVFNAQRLEAAAHGKTPSRSVIFDFPRCLRPLLSPRGWPQYSPELLLCSLRPSFPRGGCSSGC